jgi:hypothetical protein
MRRTSKLAALTVVALLALAGVAVAAKTLKHSGSIVGDPESKVKLAVVKSDGKPRAVRNMRFRNVLADCKQGDRRIDITPDRSPVKLSKRGRFNETYEVGSDKSELNVRGRVKRRGKRVTGKLDSEYFTVATDMGNARCRVVDLAFRTRKG